MFRLAAKLYMLLLLLVPLLAWWNRWLVRKGRRHIWFPAKKLLPLSVLSVKKLSSLAEEQRQITSL